MDDVYIEKVLSGDVEAYRYFLRKYKDMAFNVAVSIVKDDQYAEEVIQDAFLKAFKGLNTFKKTAKFKTWFYRIVVNEAFQKLRKIKKELTIVDVNKLTDVSFISMFESEEHESSQKIQKALSALSPKEGLVLNLFYLEEYNLNEIREMTGWTVANIKVILHRARINLRTMMGSTYKQKS